MKYRKLRIAFSAVCGVLCVLLIVLWVRSHYFADLACWRLSNNWGYQFTSTHGQLVLVRAQLDGAGYDGTREWQTWLWSTTRAGSMFDKQPATFGFNLRHWPRLSVFPYWAPLIVCMALTATLTASLFHRFRFSLRILLIGITLIAVTCGVAVMMMRGS